jgi:anti-anti-sigma factor
MVAVVLPPSAARTDRSVAAVRAEGTRTVVVLRGEWDLSTRSVLADVLSRVIASGTGDVVIDLAEAEFIDTATVRAFVDAQHLLDGHGRRLSFVSPSSLARRLLDLFGLTDRIDHRRSVATSRSAPAA